MNLSMIFVLSFLTVQALMLINFLYENKKSKKVVPKTKEDIYEGEGVYQGLDQNVSDEEQHQVEGVKRLSLSRAFENQTLLGDFVQNYEHTVENNMQPSNMDSNDYLPKECNNKWFGFNNEEECPKPVLNTAKLIDLEKYTSSLDTIGTTNRNSTYDIRGEIPVEKHIVSPFLNSSIDYNLYSKNALCN